VKQTVSKIGDQSAQAIAESSFCCRLKRLNLRATLLTDRGVVCLLTSHNCERLEELKINWMAAISELVVDTLLEQWGKTLKCLKKIYLNDTSVSLASLKDLQKLSPHLTIIYNQ